MLVPLQFRFQIVRWRLLQGSRVGPVILVLLRKTRHGVQEARSIVKCFDFANCMDSIVVPRGHVLVVDQLYWLPRRLPPTCIVQLSSMTCVNKLLPRTLRLIEGADEVGAKIFEVFQPYRNTNQSVVEPVALSFFRRVCRMRHAGRMLHKRLGVSETDRTSRQCQTVHESFGQPLNLLAVPARSSRRSPAFGYSPRRAADDRPIQGKTPCRQHDGTGDLWRAS